MTLKNPMLLTEFKEIVKNQRDCYKDVLVLAKQKTDVLVSGDVKKLEEITEAEQVLIGKLGILEERREKILEKISLENEIGREKLTADYLSKLPLEDSKELSAVFDDLREILNQITLANKTNEQLIHRALDYINFSIGLLTEAGTDSTGYGADGANATQKTYNFIDKKA